MMEGWKEVKLGEITSLIKRGVSPKYVESLGYTIINQKCIRNGVITLDNSRLTSKEKKISDEKFVQFGDTLINSTGAGTLGRTAFFKLKLDKKITVDTHVTIVRPDEKVDSKFLGSLLNLQENVIEGLGKGATNQTELSASDIFNLKINLPPIHTQQKIASILSAYDDLIENNLKRIKLLEEMAQQTYEEWFVRMRFPGYEDAVINEETGLPEGWENGTLSDICGYLSGYAFKSKDFKTQGNGVIKIKNIGQNTISIENVDYVDEQVCEKAYKHKLTSGDLLIAMTGATVGKVGVMPRTDIDFYLNQRVGKFTGLNINFINCFFNSVYGYNQIVNIAGGAAQPNISGGQILGIDLIVPPREILVRFEKETRTPIDIIISLIRENQRLKEARDILLPRLMSGMIEV